MDFGLAFHHHPRVATPPTLPFSAISAFCATETAAPSGASPVPPSIGGALKRKQAGAVASPRPKRAQYLGSDTPGGAGSARGRAHAAGTPQLSSAIESSARVDEDYMEANRVARWGHTCPHKACCCVGYRCMHCLQWVSMVRVCVCCVSARVCVYVGARGCLCVPVRAGVCLCVPVCAGVCLSVPVHVLRWCTRVCLCC